LAVLRLNVSQVKINKYLVSA